MFRDRGAVTAGVVALLVAACISILGCEDPITPPPVEPAIDSAEALIEALAHAYGTRDLELFISLLAHDPSANAGFVFSLSEPTDLGETSWGYDEEVRIHQRMFHPQTAEPPLATDLWLDSLGVDLAMLDGFTERDDLYSANAGLDGKLDPQRWRAVQARYTTDLFLDLKGTDYGVEGEANFVVIEDRSKSTGNAGKFLLLSWKDSPCGRAVFATYSDCGTWGRLKRLYR